MKREVARFDFKAFGQAIKAARKAKGISRNQLADKMNIAPAISRPLRIADSTQACKSFMSLLRF